MNNLQNSDCSRGKPKVLLLDSNQKLMTFLSFKAVYTSTVKRSFLPCCLLAGLLQTAFSDVTVSGAAPAADVLASSPDGGINSRIFDEAADDNHARGQLFSLGNSTGSAFDISAITLRKNGNQDFNGSTLTLRIYEGSQADWTAGTGHSTSMDGNNYLVDTTVTLLYTEAYTLNGTYNGGDYVTFNLATPLTVNESSAFGFFFVYDQATGDDTSFAYSEGTNGGRSSITPGNHSVGSRSIVSFVQGVPTGSSNGNLPSLTLGSPFQDRLVLQRDKPVKIWGTTDAGGAITVAINGHNVTGTADAIGDWEVEIPASSATPVGSSHILTVTSSNGTASTTETINNVLFGDVWFCTGQSNMRWRFNNFNSTWENFYRTEIAANDRIRCLRTIEDGSLTEEETTEMTWLANSSVHDWSAVGSVFAHQLNAATDVPIAIIDSAWGSSSIEGWLPHSLSEELPHFEDMLTLYQSIGEYRSGQQVATRVTDGSIPGNYMSNEEAIAGLSGSGFSNNSQSNIFMRTRPNIIYNERVHPLIKFGLAGFIWYQGEANSSIIDSAQYQFTLPRMVEEYRKRFEQGDLPFLGVQLPSFNNTSWPWFREAQDSLLTFPNGYVAITIDTGSASTIHPSDKEEIGARLSLLAREHVLGEAIESDSPRYLSHSINGNQVTLTFDHASGLTTGSRAAPAGFEIAGSDQDFQPATSSSISGNTITVSSTSVPTPVAVRYAWTATTHTFVNVRNNAPQPTGATGSPLGSGLPLAPFRTDDWPLPGLAAQVPVGNDDAYSVQRDQALAISANGVLANDFDLNLDPLAPLLDVTTNHGTLTLQPDGSFTYSPEAGFAGQDFFTYQAAEVDGPLSSPAATVSITVEGVPSAYYTWRTGTGIAWNPGDDQTATGDPDSDGLTNLLEFALGLDPLVASVEGLPTLDPTSEGADFNFNNIQPGITYEVLLSTDLVTWSDPAFATLDSTSTTPVSLPASEEDDGRLFVRLRVSETD